MAGRQQTVVESPVVCGWVVVRTSGLSALGS